MNKATHTATFNPPLETLREVIDALDDFHDEHYSEGHQVRFRVTPTGKVKGFTVKEES